MPRLWFGNEVSDEDYDKNLTDRSTVVLALQRALQIAQQRPDPNVNAQEFNRNKKVMLKNALSSAFTELNKNPGCCPEIIPTWYQTSTTRASLLKQDYLLFAEEFLVRNLDAIQKRDKNGYDYPLPQQIDPNAVKKNEPQMEEQKPEKNGLDEDFEKNELENGEDNQEVNEDILEDIDTNDVPNPFEGVNQDEMYKAAAEGAKKLTPVEQARLNLLNIKRILDIPYERNNQNQIDQMTLEISNQVAAFTVLVDENPEVANIMGPNVIGELNNALTDGQDFDAQRAALNQFVDASLKKFDPVRQAGAMRDAFDDDGGAAGGEAGNGNGGEVGDNNILDPNVDYSKDNEAAHRKAVEILTRLNNEANRSFEDDNPATKAASNAQIEKDLEAFANLCALNEAVDGHLEKGAAEKLKDDFKKHDRRAVRTFILHNGYKFDPSLDVHENRRNESRRNDTNKKDEPKAPGDHAKEEIRKMYDIYKSHREAVTKPDVAINNIFAEAGKEEFLNSIESDPYISKRLKKGWRKKVEQDFEKHGVVALGVFCEKLNDRFGLGLEPIDYTKGKDDRKVAEQGELIRDENLQKKYEQLTAAAESVKKQRQKLEEERRKFENEQRSIREGQKESPELVNKKGKKLKVKDDILNDKTSAERGYKDSFMKDEAITSTQAKNIRSLKYLAKQMHPNVKKSPQWKKSMAAIEEFDQFMRDIEGRTRLTAEEMEVYDRLSLRAYRASKEYVQFKNEQREKRLENAKVDPKTGKKVGEDDYLDKDDQAKIRTMEKIQNDIHEMREKMFQSNMDDLSKDMNKKCEEEFSKLAEDRKKLQGFGDEDNVGLEDNIATSIYYANRMNQLKKSGEFKLKPGETFNMAKQRMDKSLIPKESELTQVKKTTVAKNLVAKCNQNPDLVLTKEDINNEMSEAAKRIAENNKKKAETKKNIKPKEPEAGRQAPGMQ